MTAPSRKGRSRACAVATAVAVQAFLLILGLGAQVAAEQSEVSTRSAGGDLPSQEPAMAPETSETEAEIQPPVLLEKILPDYPEGARKARIQGTVVLEAIIDINGEVSDLKVLQGLEGRCTQAALRAAEGWRFAPATLRGEPVPAPLQLSIGFQLFSPINRPSFR